MRAPPQSRQQRGQALLEYLVVGLAVAAMFFVPVDGPGSETVVELMLSAIRTAFAKFLGALSLPV